MGGIGVGDEEECETRVVSSHPWLADPAGPQTKLMVAVKLRMADGEVFDMSALIDTGAEVNLVRRGLVASKYFKRALKRRRFVTANRTILTGGAVEVPCELLLHGVDMDTSEEVRLSCTMALYDADIMVDMILSYEWMATMDVDVHCRRHGLMVNRAIGPVWVPAENVELRKSELREIGLVEGEAKGEEVTENEGECEDYTLRLPFWKEAVQMMGITPTRDCFASVGNQRCALFYTKSDSALEKEWLEGEVMWLNPPWRLWPEVVQKLSESKCAALCLCPAWSKKWVRTLVGMSSRKVYYEQGTRMFERKGHPVPNTLWGMWLLRVDRGVRKGGDVSKPFKCAYVPRWRPLRELNSGNENVFDVTENVCEIMRQSDMISSGKEREKEKIGMDEAFLWVAKGDGSCLFHCAARTNDMEDVKKLRTVISNFVLEEWSREIPEIGMTVEEIVQSFGHEKTPYSWEVMHDDYWGGELELCLLAHILERRFRVFQIRGGEWCETAE